MPDQLAQLTRWIATRARACAGRPVLIAVDAEGGRVMRLSPTAGYPSTVSHQELGDANNVAVTEIEARRIGVHAGDGRHRLGSGARWWTSDQPDNPVIVGTGGASAPTRRASPRTRERTSRACTPKASSPR